MFPILTTLVRNAPYVAKNLYFIHRQALYISNLMKAMSPFIPCSPHVREMFLLKQFTLDISNSSPNIHINIYLTLDKYIVRQTFPRQFLAWEPTPSLLRSRLRISISFMFAIPSQQEFLPVLHYIDSLIKHSHIIWI